MLGFNFKKYFSVSILFLLLLIPSYIFAQDCDQEIRDVENLQDDLYDYQDDLVDSQIDYQKLIAKIDKRKARDNERATKKVTKAQSKLTKQQAKCDQSLDPNSRDCAKVTKLVAKIDKLNADIAKKNEKIDAKNASKIEDANAEIVEYQNLINQVSLQLVEAEELLSNCEDGTQYSLNFNTDDTTKSYVIGLDFLSNDVEIAAKHFIFSNGTSTRNNPSLENKIKVAAPSEHAGGFTTNSLATKKAVAEFDFDYDLKRLSFDYVKYSGTVNVYINSEFFNIGSLVELNDKEITRGELLVTVTGTESAGGKVRGTVTITGDRIYYLAVGGETLLVDNILGSTKE